MTQIIQNSLPHRLTLPFELFDDCPCITGMMNGKPSRFLFDSGAQSMAINASRFNTDELEEGGGVRGLSGAVKSHFVVIDEISFGPWKVNGLEAMTMDMTHLEEEVGSEIHGILGFREMVYFDWMVDYKRSELNLWNRFPRDEYEIIGKTRLIFRHHFATVEMKILGEPYQFIVDTGCETNCIDHNLIEKMGLKRANLENESLASASPEEIDSLVGTIEGFEVAGLEFGPSEAKFMDMSRLQAQFGPFAGITGYPLLKKYRTVQSWNFHSLMFLAD